VSTLAANVGLIVAALDLNKVQLLRGAMRAADIASGRAQAVSGLGPAPTPPPSQLVREPQFEPRRVIYPEPRYEPRPVIHPTPLKEYLPPIRVKADVQVEANVVSAAGAARDGRAAGAAVAAAAVADARCAAAESQDGSVSHRYQNQGIAAGLLHLIASDPMRNR